MKAQFTDPRLLALNSEKGMSDTGMRIALAAAMETDEVALAMYNVGAHIWVEAVRTNRALLIVKGAVRARVMRVPLPLDVRKTPREPGGGVRITTPLGAKTLWGSANDPSAQLLLDAGSTSPHAAAAAGVLQCPPGVQARRSGRPKNPRRRRVRQARCGWAPPAQIWDLADNCVKCGRPLTDPRSRQARVGSKCIRVWGSQQRRIPNPDHAAWQRAKTRARVDYLAEKTAADADYERARLAYRAALAEWKLSRRS
jgi:hypothetical protein